ncbi:MAG: PFL family protein [Clostridia bacterium]|nr:PFL family protein [Clostridia bacterium]
MINAYDIIETIKMIDEEHLDIRTVTMGISLVDCIRGDINETARLVYDKITKTAEKLVPTAKGIEAEFGIPIVNKRVSVTPISILGGAVDTEDLTPIAIAMQRAADTLGIDFIGGFSALVEKGFTKGDLRLINSIPSALTATERVCSSVNVGSTKGGINMDAVRMLGNIILDTAHRTADRDSIGCAKLVIFANAVQDNPFMAGAFHGISEPEAVINVGVSGPGVVKAALEKAPDADLTTVSEIIKKTAFKITRMGQLVNNLASERLGVPSGIVDLSLAPTPAVGDSVARILEEMGVGTCGGCGTTACLALLNDAVKKGGVMASSHVGGLSGAFIPVSEDEGMIAAAESGILTLEKLEAMTAVCSVGIDMVAIPGDTPADVISAFIADEIAIGVVNTKTTAVRVIPAIGKKAGDSVCFGGLLGQAPIMPIKTASPAKFIARGGLIPAPLHSLKN